LTTHHQNRHPWRIVRLVRGRPRLFTSILLTVLIGLLAPTDWRVITRWLLAWNLGTLAYFILTGWMMITATPESLRHRAEVEDEGRFAILILTSIAALSSIGAIIAQLAFVKDLSGLEKGLHITLAASTIVSAWLFIHLMFALHYAHDYFAAAQGKQSAQDKQLEQDRKDQDGGLRGGLNFPETKKPDYFDFLYFSYVIGVASQTADVSITSKIMRRTALVHCVLAFFFNSAVLALTINIAAGLI